MEEHRATVEVDAPPSGKRFQGAWLRLDTGKRLLADYRPKFYKAFDGLKVQVKGECWEPDPQAQAIMAQHFRVQELDVAEGNEGSPEFVGLRGVITLKGRIEVMRGEAGSKSEDESRLVFREIREGQEGIVWGLANPSDLHEEPGKDVEVQAREILRSPFWTHSDARTLWVLGRA